MFEALIAAIVFYTQIPPVPVHAQQFIETEKKPVTALEFNGILADAPAYDPVQEEISLGENQDRISKLIGDPLLIKIAWCESYLQQYDKKKGDTVLKSFLGTEDYGVFQINLPYHLKRSRELGYDIMTTQGNIDYSKLLYDESGTQPWLASQSCWSKKA